MSSPENQPDLQDTNQHYITKAHLDRFIHPESSQQVLYPYRKGGAACKPRGTKRLGSATNFYRQMEDGALNDRLDEARKISETLLFSSGKRTAGALAQCIFNDDFAPSQSDRLHLAAAAAFLFCGSPAQIHNTAMQALLFQQMDLFNRLNTDELKGEYRKRFGKRGDRKLKADRNRVLKGDLFADVGRKNWKQLGFMSFQFEEDAIKLLLGMKMAIVDAHASSFFLTSDNPVIRKFPSGPDKLDDELWFPISYRRGVYWHRRNLPDRLQLDEEKTSVLNRTVIKFAYKFVFSPLPNNWVESAVKQETHDVRWGHYGSLEKVIRQARPAVGPDGQPRGEIVDLIAAMQAGSKHDIFGI